MLVHLIQFKGNGKWVLGMPLLICFVLATLADMFTLDMRYLGAVTLVLSGIILFFMDNRRKTITDGDLVPKVIKLPRERRKNTVMWIEVRYWAILYMVIGVVWMFNA